MIARQYWLSCSLMTVLAAVDEAGLIVETAPVTRRFVGQHVGRLVSWLRGMGGFEMAEICRGEGGE